MRKIIDKIIFLLKKAIDFIDNKWKQFISMKYVKIIFKFLPNNLLLFILFIILITLTINFSSSKKYDPIYSQLDSSIVNKPIINEPQTYDVKITKSLPTKKLKNMCIEFGTYIPHNSSAYNIEIKTNNNVILNQDFYTSTIKGNKYNCFNVNSENLENNYNIKITPINADNQNKISTFSDKNNNLAISINAEPTINIEMISYLFFGLIFILINYLINEKKIKENIFYIILLVYFIPLTILTPPYQVPDEPYHFFRAYNISQLSINKSLYNNINNKEITVPENINCLDYSNYSKENKVNDLNLIKTCNNNSNNVSQEYKWNNQFSASFGFLFSSIGIKIADIITNNPLFIFYFGRLFNMLICALIIFEAIKITPIHKKTIIFLATIPMFLQQMCSYSYDSVLNSICILFLAYSINIIYNKVKINWKVLLKILIMLFIIGNIKANYLCIALILLFLPKECYKKKNDKLFFYCEIIFSMVLFFIVFKMFDNLGPKGMIDNNFKNQLIYLISSPKSIVSIAINTLSRYGNNYLKGIVGYFGWFNFSLPDIYIWIYTILLIILSFSEKSILNKKINKIIFLCGILITIVGIFGILYCSFTPFQNIVVEGVQGRYFLPLLFPIMLIISSRNKKIVINNNFIYSFTNIILMQFLILIANYYY